MDINNFNVLESEIAYRAPKFEVESLKIRTCEDKIVNWDRIRFSNVVYCLPLDRDGQVMLNQEWRPGPEKVLTHLSGARFTTGDGINELKKELAEELGITGGTFTQLLTNVSNGPHISGYFILYLVTDFEIGSTNMDENEIIQVLRLPKTDLFNNLRNNYLTTPETLLAARILEDRSN